MAAEDDGLEKVVGELQNHADPDLEELAAALDAAGLSELGSRLNSLRSYKRRFEGVMLAANLAWWELRLPDGEVDFNPRKAEMLGYSPERFQHYEDFTELLHPEDYERTMQAMRDHLEGDKDRYEVEYRIRTVDGDYKWYYDVGGVIREEGEEKQVVGVVLDITEQKELKFKLKQSLAEKEVLIDEIFHRIKNNLQQLSGLLNLQARKSEEPVVREALQESRSRIGSLAQLYDEFFRMSEKGQVKFDKYVRDLAEKITDFYRTESQKVELVVEVEENLELEHKIAVHCGLILNELLTNSMKYATNDVGTVIEVGCELTGDECVLRVADNGPGLPDDFDLEDSESLGLKIVKILSEEQLKGEFNLNSSSEGTSCEVQFSVAN